MSSTILITRPEPGAQDFADALRVHLGGGIPIILSPMQQNVSSGALPDLDKFSGLVFTSRTAVQVFAGLTDRRDLPAYCVGDATAAAAQAAGLKAQSASGDADALVDMLRTGNVKGPLLHLRGTHSRGEVAIRLGASQAIIYSQKPQSLTAEAQAALSRESPVILPLFSPRSAQLFFSGALPHAPLFVAVISEATAQMVPPGAARRMVLAERPDARAMLRAVLQFAAPGKSLEGGKPAR